MKIVKASVPTMKSLLSAPYYNTNITLPPPVSNSITRLNTTTFQVSTGGWRLQPPQNMSAVSLLRYQSPSNPQSSGEDDDDDGALVQDLRVPDHWLLPSKALEESKWLRVTLHKWLDEEYCPEDTNVEISKVAAHSYYRSLLQKRTDLGEILLTMATDLESISYQESFHGAFSSANAAVTLILQRIELEGNINPS